MFSAKEILVSRTFLFNYGRGDISPFSIYRKLCRISEVSPVLTPIPTVRFLALPISFFSKERVIDSTFYPQLALFDITETELFVSLPTAVKLNWFRNFSYMQELLFNFTDAEISNISTILRQWKRPSYDYLRLPFSVASGAASTNSSLQASSLCSQF